MKSSSIRIRVSPSEANLISRIEYLLANHHQTISSRVGDIPLPIDTNVTPDNNLTPDTIPTTDTSTISDINLTCVTNPI